MLAYANVRRLLIALRAFVLGQITRYIMRPSAEMKAFLHEAKYRFQFRRPIVGIHVRRTDKVGSEAAFHPLSEYMQFVEDYYNQLELKQQREGKVSFRMRCLFPLMLLTKCTG